MAAMLVLSKMGHLDLAWSWLIVIGTVTTFTLAYLLSPAVKMVEQAEAH
jgi:hypothetical protein